MIRDDPRIIRTSNLICTSETPDSQYAFVLREGLAPPCLAGLQEGGKMPEAGCVEEYASLQGEPLLVGNPQSMPPCLLLMDPNQEAHWPCSTVMVKPSGAAGLTSKDRLSRRDFWWVAVDLFHRFSCGMCHGEVEVLAKGRRSLSKYYGVGIKHRASCSANGK